MSTVEWHGHHAYDTCPHCKKLVRVNKGLLGSLHICLSLCERRKFHTSEEVRVGAFWRRRTIIRCTVCSRELPS